MKLKHLVLLIILRISISFPQTIDSTTTNTDTLSFADSTKIILPDSALTDTTSLFGAADSIAADTLRPLYQKPFSDFSYFISNHDILRLDYQSAYDLLRLFPLSFISETGLYGNPADPVIYGASRPGMAFLENQILLSNPDAFSNLNLAQTETVDSVEVINLPRTFLYSPIVTPVAVNFIERDFLSPSPYTRIKYFEGPFGQAYFDGIFNALIFNRLNLFLDITNTISDSSYRNSSYDSWQGTAKLKYLFSSSFNIAASYKLAKTTAGINGGINVDSIVTNPGWSEEDIYNERGAIVRLQNGSLELTMHNFKIQSLWQPQENWNTQISLYLLFGENLDAYSNNDSLKTKLKNYTYGISLNQRYSEKLFALKLMANYLNNEQNTANITNGVDPGYNTVSGYQFSLAPEASLYLMDSSFIPSIFFKYASVKNVLIDNYSGFGLDINYMRDNIRFYAGYSSHYKLSSESSATNFEVGAAYSSEYADGYLRYFSVSGNPYFTPGALQDMQFTQNGIGLKLALKYNAFVLENSGYILLKNDSENFSRNTPDFNLISGIYYNNIVFDEHLNIKTGFRLMLSEGDKAKDLYNGPISLLFNNINYRIDFTLAGEISKVAMVYFTWENLTNNNYFIIPFYPMPERNIRFGVAWELFN